MACTDSTEPKSDGVLISCSPANTDFQASLGDTVYFEVTRQPTGAMDIAWTVDEEDVITGAVFLYIASSLGEVQISASVLVDGVETVCSWNLIVVIGDTQPPPSIFALNVNHGLEIGGIVVGWPRVIPNNSPISHYLLAYSTAGPVYADTWNEAISLGRVDELTEGILHSVSFNADSGIPGGVMVWIGAIAVDEQGVQSVVPGGGSIIPSYPWFIHGVIFGDNGLPLHNVFVGLGYSHSQVYTNQAGEFTGGPFSSRETISLYTITSDNPDEGSGFFDSYYDVEIDDITPNGDVALEVYLIPRYGIDAMCNEEVYSGDFLRYFMEMTKTIRPTGGRADRKLYKWEQYPVPVYIPEYINANGLDMAAISRSGLELWNTIMGEDYFTLVDNIDEANIFFQYDHSLPAINGQATMVQPDAFIGDAIPERIKVYINDNNPSAQWIKEVVIHELCHAIGCASHAVCNEPGYLMYIDPGGVLDGDPLDAIHIDEKRMIRAIRYLPMGYDLGSVEIY